MEQITKKIALNEKLVYKLKVSAFEQIGLSQSIDNSVVLLDETDRCLTINENNIGCVEQLFLFAGSSNRNYAVIPFKNLDKYIWIMPNDFGEKHKLSCTNYKMLSFELELIRIDSPLSHSNQLMNNEQNTSFDLTTKMSGIRAIEMFPANTDQMCNQFDNDSCTNIKTNVCNVLRNEPSPYDSLKNFLEENFNILNKNVEELKLKLDIVNNRKAILDSNLTLDSAMLINSIQKIIAENHKLKIELEDKKNEMIHLNQKLFKLIENGSSDSGCSTPNVEILKLKEEIIILKERINELREENCHYKWEKNLNLIKSDAKQLKEISSKIREQFDDTMRIICEKDQHYLDNLLDSVLQLIAEIDDNSDQKELKETSFKK